MRHTIYVMLFDEFPSRAPTRSPSTGISEQQLGLHSQNTTHELVWLWDWWAKET